jgi:alpha-glucosidase
VLSNHDFARLPDRVGPENVRTAVMLLLTLPGLAFLFQGDEIAMRDGPGHDPPYDRADRDRHRHPMQWDPSPKGGFTTGDPWLPLIDPAQRNVADQSADPRSQLALTRRLIALRSELEGSPRFLDTGRPDVLAFDRGRHRVVLNLGPEQAPDDLSGKLLVSTDPDDPGGDLPAHAGRVSLRD